MYTSAAFSSKYMRRAYQSPHSGTHWTPQWQNIPRRESSNHAGVPCSARLSHVGSKAAAFASAGAATAAASAAPMIIPFNISAFFI